MPMMSKREREMLLDQLRGGQPQIGGAATPLAATQATPAPQPELTGKNLMEIQALRNKPSNAMEAVMGARSPTAFTALAKGALAGFAGHKGRKERSKEEAKLTKALERENRERDAALQRTRKREDDADAMALRQENRGISRDEAADKLAQRKVVVSEGRLKLDVDKSKLPQLGKPETWWQVETGKSKNFQFDKQGRAFDAQGEPVSVDGYKDTKPSGTGFNSDGTPKPLTENQAAIRLEHLEKKLNPPKLRLNY